MATNAEVKSFLNAVAKIKYGKRYSSLTDKQASAVRKAAHRIAFNKTK